MFKKKKNNIRGESYFFPKIEKQSISLKEHKKLRKRLKISL